MLRVLVKVYPLSSDVSLTPLTWYVNKRDATAALPAGTPAAKVQLAEVAVKLVIVPSTPSYMQDTSTPLSGKLRPVKSIPSEPFITTELSLGDEAKA